MTQYEELVSRLFESDAASALRAKTLECRLAEAGNVIARMRVALKPMSGAVYNDNGDMTIAPADIQIEGYIAAYFADRAAAKWMEGKSDE